MRFMVKLFIIVTVLFFTVSCIRETEAGQNDWSIQNVGEITQLKFRENKLAFLSKLNIFGFIDRKTGAILKRVYLATGERIIDYNSREIIVGTAFNQILIYRQLDLQMFSDLRFMDESAPIQGYAKLVDNTVYVANAIDIRIFKDQNDNHQVLYTFGSDEKFIKLIKSDDNEENVYMIYESKGNVCVKILSRNQLKDKMVCQTIPGTILNININQEQIYITTKQQTSIRNYFIDTLTMKITLSNIVGEIIQINQNQFYNGTHSINVKDGLIKPGLRIPGKYGQQIEVNSFIKSQNLHVIQLSSFGSKFGNPIYSSNCRPIKRIWAHIITQVQYSIVIQFQDLQIAYYAIEGNTATQPLWVREQSLAYIQKVVFRKYTLEYKEDNDYHEEVVSHNYKNLPLIDKLMKVPEHFIKRTRKEANNIIDGFFLTIQHILSFFNSVGEKGFSLKNILNPRNFMRFKMSEQQEKRYGLRKNIVMVTQQWTILALDSKTKQIVWKKNADSFKNRKLVNLFKMKIDYQDDITVLITFSDIEKATFIDQIDDFGNIIPQKKIETEFIPTIHKLNPYALLIKIGKNVQKFVVNDFYDKESISKEYYFYETITNEKGTDLIGWKESQPVFQSSTDINQLISVWNIHFSPNEKIITQASSFQGEQSRIPLVDQDKVIFKNIDYTNFAIATRNNKTLNLYIINGKTGHIQFNQYQTGVSFQHPINLAYDENSVFLTYFSLKNRMYQVWVVEEYQDRIQASALNIIQQYMNGFQIKPSVNRQSILFITQVFGSTVSIKNLFISESKESLIKRNMVVITEHNQCYTIMREFVTPRRPKEGSLFSNEKFPPYEYLLPYIPTNFYTQQHQLANINNVRFSSSEMQSTIFLLARGTDIFMMRFSPDKTFDMITQEFNFIMLIVIVIAVTFLVLFLRNKAKNAKLTKPHHD